MLQTFELEIYAFDCGFWFRYHIKGFFITWSILVVILIHWTSNMPLIFYKGRYLNSGSICALYLLYIMITNSSFLLFGNSTHSNPEHVVPNWIWDKINESYLIFIAENSKYRLIQQCVWGIILLAIFTSEYDPTSWIQLSLIQRNLILSPFQLGFVNFATFHIQKLLWGSYGVSLYVQRIKRQSIDWKPIRYCSDFWTN